MFGLFGRKKKAKEEHEQELKDRLASRLVNYEPANNSELSEFVRVDFGEGKKVVAMMDFSDDPWTEVPSRGA